MTGATGRTRGLNEAQMALPSPLMPAEILSQCIQRVEGGPSLGKSRCFEPWSRARTGRNGGSVPLSGASDADTRPWPGFPGGVKRLGCFDARPPCVLRPAGVLAPHWSARTPPTPHLHLPPPPERSWGRGSRGKLSFFSARFVNKGEKKNEYAQKWRMQCRNIFKALATL